MKKGTEVVLTKGARVPQWLRFQDKFVEITNMLLNFAKVRSLKIWGGEAAFFPGGNVGIITPAMSEYVVAFLSKKVLVIRDLKGKIVYQNYYTCSSCMDTSGKVVDCKKEWSPIVSILKFECSRCKKEWEIEVH